MGGQEKHIHHTNYPGSSQQNGRRESQEPRLESPGLETTSSGCGQSSAAQPVEQYGK